MAPPQHPYSVTSLALKKDNKGETIIDHTSTSGTAPSIGNTPSRATLPPAFLEIEQEILALQATSVTDVNKAEVIRQISALVNKLTDYNKNSTALTDGTLDNELTTRIEAVKLALSQQIDSISKLNASSSPTSLVIPQVEGIQTTNRPISSIVPRVEDPPIAPKAEEELRTNLWNWVDRYITGDTPYAHWMNKHAGLSNLNFTTADFQHFQAQCLQGLKDPDEAFNQKRGGLFKPPNIKHDRIKHYLATGGAFSVSENILTELRRTGVERGLSSEDNHLALAYAYYNHALLLCAAGAGDYKVRMAFENCKEFLEPVDYVTRGSDGQVFYEHAKGYLEYYMGTDAHITTPELPTAKEIVGLLPFPVFQSEVAHHNLKKATETLKTHLTEAKKAENMNPLLKQAEDYYQGIIDNPEMENRWHGHAGMAEVLALKSKLAELAKREGDAERLKQQAREQLELAKKNSIPDIYKTNLKLLYQYGNTLPEPQEIRIRRLLQ
jgi:hypothetical protein